MPDAPTSSPALDILERLLSRDRPASRRGDPATRGGVRAAPDTGPRRTRARPWSQARRRSLETRYLALSTEIETLDQELLSRSLRMQLLEAKRDKEEASVAWIGERIRALNDQWSERKR